MNEPINLKEHATLEPNSLNPETSYQELESIFPEVHAMKNYDQRNPHHHLTLDKHTQEVDSLLKHDHFIEGLSTRQKTLISLAAKLHDIGKPQTAIENKKSPGTFNYIGHEIKSTEMSQIILQKFFLTEQEREWISNLIRLHAASLNIANNFMQNDQPKGKQLGAYDNFIASVEKMPGSDTPEGREKNLHICISFTKGDTNATANSTIKMTNPDIAKDIEGQVNSLNRLENAIPAIIQAVDDKRNGIQTGGIIREGNTYKAVVF